MIDICESNLFQGLLLHPTIHPHQRFTAAETKNAEMTKIAITNITKKVTKRDPDPETPKMTDTTQKTGKTNKRKKIGHLGSLQNPRINR